jgi:SWI/SNF-related matrix-associated actin-dependent regulator of chromatin subfamily A member 5
MLAVERARRRVEEEGIFFFFVFSGRVFFHPEKLDEKLTNSPEKKKKLPETTKFRGQRSGFNNIYEYKDGEEGGDGGQGAGADGEALRALIGHNWIDPPKRERKRVATYNESDYYRQAMKLGGGGGGGGPRASAAPRLPKMPALQDFQFYDVKRITALYEKEAAHETHKHSLAEKERSARAQGASEEVVQAQIAPGPDDPQPLSEAETAEREALLASGFANWNRRDFAAFIRACEKVKFFFLSF